MARHLRYRRNVASIAQMICVNAIKRCLSHHCAFTRRILADYTLIDGFLTMGDRRDLEYLFHLARTEIATRLAKRCFGLENVSANNAFHNDLGIGRDNAIKGLCLDHIDWRAVQRARHTEFINAIRHLGGSRHQQCRRTTDKQRHFEVLTHPASFFPLDSKMLGRHVGRTANPVRRFDHAAINTHIIGAVFGVTRYPDTRRNKGGRVKARCRDQMREGVDTLTHIRCFQDNLLNRRILCTDGIGWQMIAMGTGPFCGDSIRSNAKRRTVDDARTAERAKKNRRIIINATGIRYVLEPKGFSFRFRQPPEL